MQQCFCCGSWMMRIWPLVYQCTTENELNFLQGTTLYTQREKDVVEPWCFLVPSATYPGFWIVLLYHASHNQTHHGEKEIRAPQYFSKHDRRYQRYKQVEEIAAGCCHPHCVCTNHLRVDLSWIDPSNGSPMLTVSKKTILPHFSWSMATLPAKSKEGDKYT